jgi:acyl carrier protein
MEINEFINNFADQFDDTTVDDLSPETVFHELDDYSSIVALSIIAMIDEEYGVALTGNEMKAAVTIQDLFNTVQARIA